MLDVKYVKEIKYGKRINKKNVNIEGKYVKNEYERVKHLWNKVNMWKIWKAGKIRMKYFKKYNGCEICETNWIWKAKKEKNV